MCSTENNAELQPTRKCSFLRPELRVYVVIATQKPGSGYLEAPPGTGRAAAAPPEEMNVSDADFVLSLPPPAASDPALLLELKTRRPPSLVERAGCETWSVDFSPDGAWFAWSMGHGIVWVVAWPLDSE